METIKVKLANTLVIGGRMLAIVSILSWAVSCNSQDEITPENAKTNQKIQTPKNTPKAFMDDQPPKNGNSGGGI